MGEEESTTQQLQNKVDKLKLLNLAQNIHNLTPPSQQQEDPARDIALVNALSAHPRIQRKILEIRGLEYNKKKKEFEQVAEPRMNIDGAKLIADILTTIAEEIEWASYSEEEIPQRIIHFYEENIPYILFYHEDYDLSPKYFGYIINMLQVFIDSSFHKAKSGKYINTLGRTYDEGTLRRALDTNAPMSKKQEGVLAKHNPFRNR
jgi:hypothetical protein